MAILWRKGSGGTRYEVRSAGRSRRLYKDGVLHSQYNPRQPVTGRVWDLLLLPAFFRPPGTVRRVLILGVGGGTLIRQLRHFVEPATVIGVDLDPVHMQVARRYFGVREDGVTTLHVAEAREWLSAYRGPPFDLIVDDLFTEENGEPVRAVEAACDWVTRLAASLSRDGVLVVNFVSGRELARSALLTRPSVARRFRSAFRLTTPVEENVVGAFVKPLTTSRDLRRRLTETPGLNPQLASCPLRYSIRALNLQ